MSKHDYIDPSDVEFVDRVYIVTLTLRENEEPPSIAELVRILYQGVGPLDSEDAVLVERVASTG